MILYTTVLLILLLITILAVDCDVLDYLNKRKGLYSVDCLMDVTGIFDRSELSALVGHNPENNLFRLSEDTFRRLPRKRIVLFIYHPLINLACMTTYLMLLPPLIGGRFYSEILCIPGIYTILITLAWTAYWDFKKPDEDEDEDFPDVEMLGPENFSGEDIEKVFTQYLHVIEASKRLDLRLKNDGHVPPLMGLILKLCPGLSWKRERREYLNQVEDLIKKLESALISIESSGMQDDEDMSHHYSETIEMRLRLQYIQSRLVKMEDSN